jgi:hypothetical protein
MNSMCVNDSNHILTPLIFLILLALLMDLLNSCTTKIKRQGESVKSYIIPLKYLKKFDVDPFINTSRESVVTHTIIHLIKGSENPM